MNSKHTYILLSLTLLLLGASVSGAQVQSEWWYRSNEFRSKHYNVKTDFPQEDALAMARHMDITCDAYIAMFYGLRNWRRTRLNMCLFVNRQDYMHTLHTRFQSDGTGSGGLCITRGDSISLVAWKGHNSLNRMRVVMQHEGFHQFSKHLFPNLPAWADEGLATLFERGIIVDDKMVLGEVSAHYKRKLVAAVENQEFRSFDQFFMIGWQEWCDHVKEGHAHVNYLQAWSIVHFFLYADDGAYQKHFLNFLLQLNNGIEWKMAFVTSFGMPDLGAMEKKWLEYVEGVHQTNYREIVCRLEFLAKGMLELRGHGIYPGSLEELKQEMRKIDFKCASEMSAMFGVPRTIRASCEWPFEIPYAKHNPSKPTYRLVDNRGRIPKQNSSNRANAADRKAGKSRRGPAPLNIVTVGLQPRNFAVRWKATRARQFKPVFHAE